MSQKLTVLVGRQPTEGSICTSLPRFKLLRQNEHEKRLFLKEATILNGLSNGQIVQLKAVCVINYRRAKFRNQDYRKDRFVVCLMNIIFVHKGNSNLF